MEGTSTLVAALAAYRCRPSLIGDSNFLYGMRLAFMTGALRCLVHSTACVGLRGRKARCTHIL